MMKKIAVWFLGGICLFFLCACEKHVNNLNSEVENFVYDSTSEMVIDNQVVGENNANESLENANISVAQVFASVLFNEKEFVCTDNNPYADTNVITEFRGFLKDSPYGFGERTSIKQIGICLQKKK